MATNGNHRYRRARKDAMLCTIQAAISNTFDLPINSINLVLPGGRKARSTASADSLRKKWAKTEEGPQTA